MGHPTDGQTDPQPRESQVSRQQAKLTLQVRVLLAARASKVRSKCPEHREPLMKTEALKETLGGNGIVNRQHTTYVQK